MVYTSKVFVDELAMSIRRSVCIDKQFDVSPSCVSSGTLTDASTVSRQIKEYSPISEDFKGERNILQFLAAEGLLELRAAGEADILSSYG